MVGDVFEFSLAFTFVCCIFQEEELHIAHACACVHNKQTSCAKIEPETIMGRHLQFQQCVEAVQVWLHADFFDS